MRSSRAWCVALVAVLVSAALALQPAVAQFRAAAAGYRYEFPRDYFSHPDYQTEWWYYTGNLTAADGHAYGFELTFFRVGVNRPPANAAAVLVADWAVNDIYMAHLALSDLDGRHFYHRERLNRAGVGTAGIDASTGRIWNGNWQVAIHSKGETQQLDAVSEDFALHFQMASQKAPVIHGIDGVSQKSAEAGHGSQYISLTRLAVNGTIDVGGAAVNVSGVAWMDHEFFTEQLDQNQTGWDWLSVQLEDNTELMLYRIRRADGTIDPFSSGTYIDASGKPTHLRLEDFEFAASGAQWTSPASKATYPIHWTVRVKPLGLTLDVSTPLVSQEIFSGSPIVPSYWEGAVRVKGDRGGVAVKGVGYLELTGYDKPFRVTSSGK
jgi:predicted secreted hydrolase